MVNVHLNGDIVRCPDVAALQKKAWELKDAHKICRYNIHEDNCEAWQKSLTNWQNVKRNQQSGRCMLAGCDLCPGHRKKTELGKTDKTFKIDSTTYRKMTSTALYLHNESKHKTLFLTLTFPEFKYKEYNHLLILTEQEKNKCLNEINKCFSKFVENLRSNYGCEGYVAVREFGKITNRVHFHIVCCIPFVPFAKLNAAWCAAISNISVYSNRALTTTSETRIVERNPIRALHYICKYFSKSKGQYSATRLTFVSNNVLQRAKQYAEPLEQILDKYKFDYMRQTSDYTTCYRITDWNEQNKFFNDFLMAFFELSTGKSRTLYTYPPKSP